MADHTHRRELLVVNPTTIERFTAFSPCHVGGMADMVILAHPETGGRCGIQVKVG